MSTFLTWLGSVPADVWVALGGLVSGYLGRVLHVKMTVTKGD